MPCYKNSVIYNLRCKNEDVITRYIGSTTNLKRRITEHRTNCKNPLCKEFLSPLYSFIRSNGGWENWSMDIIAHVVCNTKEELLKIERGYIENATDLLNKKIPGRTSLEYYADNREKILEYKKQYYEENCEEMNKKKRIRYLENIDEEREKRRNHYKKHRVEILKQKKELYAKKNAFEACSMAFYDLDVNSVDHNRRVICCCNKEMNFRSLSLHRHGKRHQKYIELVNSV